MAKLYFRYGAMGSSKTANALMVAYNYKERGKKALLAKPLTDTREIGVIHSRIGLEQPCISVEELVQMDDAQAPPVGTRGTVIGVDDTGSIMVAWDNGSGLNVIYGVDCCKKVPIDD